MIIGCHASVWTGKFDEPGLTTAVSGTAEAGFDLIELPIFAPDSWPVAHTRRLLDDYGLRATASLGLSDDINISCDDPAIRGRGEMHLSRVLDVIHEIGGTHLVGVIYGPMKKHMVAATASEVAHGQDVLARLADRAAGLGIELAVEVVNRYESNILNTAKQCADYVASIGHDNLGVHLDTYHMNIEESGMFGPVAATADRLRYVHIGESHRGYLGSGTVDFDSFFRGLDHIGFTAPIVFESFSSTVVDAQLTSTLGIWRNLWDDGLDVASHANRYIRGQLRAVETISLH